MIFCNPISREITKTSVNFGDDDETSTSGLQCRTIVFFISFLAPLSSTCGVDNSKRPKHPKHTFGLGECECIWIARERNLRNLEISCALTSSPAVNVIHSYKERHFLICCFRHRGTNPLAPDAVDLTQLNSVSEWLASIKMSRYAESFERAGVTTLEAAARVTVQELTALGITLVGHQKKIMNSVTALRAQMSATSQGFLV